VNEQRFVASCALGNATIYFDKAEVLIEPVETGLVLIPPHWQPQRVESLADRYTRAFEKSRNEFAQRFWERQYQGDWETSPRATTMTSMSYSNPIGPYTRGSQLGPFLKQSAAANVETIPLTRTELIMRCAEMAIDELATDPLAAPSDELANMLKFLRG
jgi:hypothetical protein